ncbi:MAG: hypothetical protein ACLQIB_37765 [Isosphaeraceae bacterium]
MIRPGAISLANVDAGIRPAVVVSLEELNRGNWVVAVLSTSIAHFVEQFRFLREQFRLGARSIKGDLETPRAEVWHRQVEVVPQSPGGTPRSAMFPHRHGR